VDGEFLPTARFPRIDRFKEHTIELPVMSLTVTPGNEVQLRESLNRALEHGKGVVHVLHDIAGLRHAVENGLPTARIGQIEAFSTKRACPVCATSYAELDPRLFSYNSKHGWCPDCVGTGVLLTREQRAALDDSILSGDDKGREQTFAEAEVEDVSDEACPTCQGTRLNPVARAVLLPPPLGEGGGGGQGISVFTALPNTTAAAPTPTLLQRGRDPNASDAGIPITTLAHLSIHDLRAWFDALRLQGRAADIARDLLPEIKNRLDFLQQVGLGYLTLDRGAPTLSGGEAQRIRLAAQLGSNLQGVCYVLDEPTIGLHARDNRILLDALHTLSAKGNTLVVVEHDEDTIRRAEHLIDIGPGAGRQGGKLVAEGAVADLQAAPDSATGRYLRHAMRHPMQARRVVASLPPPLGEGVKWLLIRDARLHNLKHIDVAVPLKRLVAVTGVSGSGKSTLAREVLLASVQRYMRAGPKAASNSRARGHGPVGCAALEGFGQIDRVLEVDQTPIGKTPRSCPATYIGFWDTVRKLFADTLEAKARGYAPGRFSFNTGQGRCPGCEGQGLRTIEMSFLPDVKVPCEVCRGARFNPETLAVTWRGKTIGDVLQMEVDEAVEFFAVMPAIAHPLQLLKDVGLGYLTLGQPSPTLSGGEAQRIKLVTELSKVRDSPWPPAAFGGHPPEGDTALLGSGPALRSWPPAAFGGHPPEGDTALLGSGPALRLGRRGQKSPHTLYVLDEPTVGLHMQDVEKLIRVLHRLVDGGHSVVVIEHDLDLIAEADWIIDLGPEGGAKGGHLAAAGTPEDVVRAGTHTGVALAPVLARGVANDK
jgi:excinuclease ABC subunit A